MAAARNLLGAQRPLAPVPYFWSGQYDLKIRAYGHLRGRDEMRIAEGSLEERKFTLIYRTGDRLFALLTRRANRGRRRSWGRSGPARDRGERRSWILCSVWRVVVAGVGRPTSEAITGGAPVPHHSRDPTGSPGDGQLVRAVDRHVVADAELLQRHGEPEVRQVAQQRGQRDLQFGAGQVWPRHWWTP